jgi:hypothetical protein
MATKFYARQGMITKGDSNKPPVSGFDLERLLKFQLGVLNVPYYDDCCGDTSPTTHPVAEEDGVLKAYNPTNQTWEAVDLGTFAATDIALDDGSVGDLALKLGADQNNGLYGVSDTQLGIAVEGVLVGGANTTGLFTDNIAEQTSAAGVTIDSVKLKDGGVSNTAGTMFAGFFPTTAAQALSGAGAVNVTAYLTKYTSTGASQALSLASGSQIGQRKKISHVVDGGSGILTAVFVGGTTITFTTVGEFADLIWTGASWGVLELGNTATPGTPPALA